MFAAFEAGRTIEQIAQDYHLTEGRVRAVLTAEKNRRFLSPEPFYRELRAQSEHLGEPGKRPPLNRH